MVSDLPPDLTEIYSGIQQAWKACREGADKVAESYPSWKEQGDARYGVFNKCASVLTAVQLAVWFCASNRVDDAWREAYETGIMPTYPPQTSQLFGTFVRRGMMEFLCSAIESSFRQFLRSLDPTACSGATGPFESVYVCLLARLKKRKWESLLKLWRLCRNTCHNNGVYLPRKSGDDEVIFEGTTYRFEEGKVVRYGDWNTLILIATRSSDMLMDVVTSPPLSTVPSIAGQPQIDPG